MKIETTDLAGVVVATPAGRLDLASYAALRDGLLKLAADTPIALVVRLGQGFEVPSNAMLSVFTTVWMKISQWPDIPVVLLAETDEHREKLRTSGITRFVCVAGSLRDALKAAERPPRRRFRRVPLPDSPTAPLMARAVVREACETWGLPGVVDDAVLVVSELVENAVRHAHSESVLKVELRPGGLSLSVRDGDPAPPMLEFPNRDVPGHRGVQLVDRLSLAWGCAPSSDGGKIVWAVLACTEASRFS
ncbi:ATP-binding protein [Lentzea sp. NEAU-D13]|uniref:ATP-binding protein n=1 Tax=Lentzea alba TaxID=2714351 RepID=A0A7C9RQZ3_9PSEU|nr:ATP-binding protein [Lentzea alba]NGY60709.1 ATP-binding protein [Lentzea alba]